MYTWSSTYDRLSFWMTGRKSIWSYVGHIFSNSMLTLMSTLASSVGSHCIMKNSVFCDIMPSSPLKIDQHFGVRWHIDLQVWRVNQIGNKQSYYLLWLILEYWKWRSNVPLKHQLTLDRQHNIISQKMELFISIQISQSCRSVWNFDLILFFNFHIVLAFWDQISSYQTFSFLF
jgi:hypothetical protein